MTQTSKRRISIFPFFQADGAVIRPKADSGDAVEARASAGQDRRINAAVITARGQRFSLCQIGSMFGSE